MTPTLPPPSPPHPSPAGWVFAALLLAILSARGDGLPAPILTDKDARTFTFTIPAPRGLILDRMGEPLARNRSAAIVGIRLLTLTADAAIDEAQAGWKERLLARVEQAVDSLRTKVQGVTRPTDEEILTHWQHRRWLPLDVSAPLGWNMVGAQNELPPWATTRTVILRDYPAGEAGCHVIGYVSRESPVPAGAVGEEELLWPQVRGRAGLEQSFDAELTGIDGLLCVVIDANGEEKARYLVREPVPGQTIVTTLNLAIMKLAGTLLAKSERRGAIVAVDAATGDVLAMTSWPQFDLNEFVPAISTESYRALRDDPDSPLFPRAYTGAYPPGSVFKPVVALAYLQSKPYSGIGTYLPGPPSLEIDGRTFRNWSDDHEGWLDARGALVRSCNTWFYQAGIEAGPDAIVSTAKQFGFGRAPQLPLDGMEAGHLPDPRLGRQGTANLSIGQGELLVSPLQVALGMAGFANRTNVPQARLVSSLQSAAGQPIASTPVTAAPLLFRENDLGSVQAGMYGVVNHPRGTAGKAALSQPVVLGKTGTAQWRDRGKESRLYWFAGFTHTRNPRIAFAVLCEGRDGERQFSSRVAVPVAADFLKALYAHPDRYDLESPTRYRAPLPLAWYLDNPFGGGADPRALALRSSNVSREQTREEPSYRPVAGERPVEPVYRERVPLTTTRSPSRYHSRFKRPGPR